MMLHNSFLSNIFRVFVGGILLSLTACTEAIDIRTDNSKPVIVIYGTVTDILSYQEVTISSSTGYFDNMPNPRISGAKVTITSGNEVYLLTEVKNKPGLYRTTERMKGEPGRTYNLRVEVDYDRDGVNEVYEASTKMEEKVHLDSIYVKRCPAAQYNFFSIDIYGKDFPTEDYYMCRYQINDSIYNKISRYIPFNDISLNDQYINGLSIGVFPDIKDKSLYTDDQVKDMVFIGEGDSIRVQLCHITEGYFKFLFQCIQEKDGEDPFFGGPLSNIDTNISNGGIGYFTAFAVSEAKQVAPKLNAKGN